MVLGCVVIGGKFSVKHGREHFIAEVYHDHMMAVYVENRRRKLENPKWYLREVMKFDARQDQIQQNCELLPASMTTLEAPSWT